MVRVSGPLRVVTDRPLLVSQVRVRAARDRAERGGLTAAFSDTVTVTNGQLTMEVLPGPAVLDVAVAGGHSHVVRLVVPDVAEATLEQCVLAAEVAGEADKRTLERLAGEVAADRDEVRRLAGEAAGSASAASSSAGAASGSAKAAASSASNAKTSEQGAASSASAAAGSASAAKASETRAGQSATAAGQSASQASQSATAAGGSATSAGQSATAAGQSATAAGTSATNAKTSETNAGKSASAASTSASQAATSAANAKTSETRAGQSAGSAATSEQNAKDHASEAAQHEVAASGHADSAKQSADRAATIAGSTRWVGTKLEVNGKLSPDLKGPKGEPGRDGTMTFEELTPAQRASLKGDKGDPGPKGDPGRPGDPATAAERVQTKDTRNANETPGWYMSTYPQSVVSEFKSTGAVGIDRALGLYAMVYTVTPWRDRSGGYPSQTAYVGSRVLRRVGTSDTTWNGWQDMGVVSWDDVDDKPSTFTPSTHSHAWGDITGKPSTFAPSSHSHTVADLSDVPQGVRNTLKWSISTTASSAGAVAWGRNASATATDSVAIGYGAKSSQTDAAVLGSYATVTKQHHVVVGVDATDAAVAYQRGTVVIGKAGAPVIISGRNLATELDTVNARIDTRPAFFSAPDAPPAGVRVGDYWLNETTMELHKITSL